MNDTAYPKRLRHYQSLNAVGRRRYFENWLKRQPNSKTYEFSSVKNCAMCQFGRHLLKGSRTLRVTSGGDWMSVRASRGGDIVTVLGAPITGLINSLSVCDTFGTLKQSVSKLA